MHSEFIGETEPQKEASHLLMRSHESIQRLVEMIASERQAILIAYMQEQVAKALGISASQLDVQQPLNYMGIDSLIAVKLRNRLRTDLEVDVPAVKFMEDFSVTSLATQVRQLLTGAQSSSMTSVCQSHIPSWDEQKAVQMDMSDGDWLEGEI